MHQEHDQRAVLDAIRSIVRAVRRSSRSSEARLGLSAAQLFVLQKLAEAPSPSINELAAATLTHQSSVSAVVTKLDRRGLVRRGVSLRDRRRAEITLSAKGRKVLAGAPEPIQARLIAALDQLPAGDVRTLGALLARWIEAAGIADAAPPLFGEDGT